MQDEEAFDTLGIGAEKLNDTLEDTSLLVAGFDRELGRMRSAVPHCLCHWKRYQHT